ncbi:MAG: hypothetical protein ACOCYF_01965 [Bacteroidota bacterium]
MVITGIISAVLIIFILLLVLPVRLEIDSEREFIRVCMPAFFSAGLFDITTDPEIKFRFLFINIPSQVILSKKKKPEKKIIPKKKKKEKQTSFKKINKYITSLLNQFTIKKCIIDIDTGDFPLNAQLVQVAGYLNNKKCDISVNFENRNIVYFLLQTRIILILFTIIKYKMSN